MKAFLHCWLGMSVDVTLDNYLVVPTKVNIYVGSCGIYVGISYICSM